jgi:hypothetical protein
MPTAWIYSFTLVFPVTAARVVPGVPQEGRDAPPLSMRGLLVAQRAQPGRPCFCTLL